MTVGATLAPPGSPHPGAAMPPDVDRSPVRQTAALSRAALP